jgi:4-diphosphocytidyl-2-C-methyl-D-erythritol kinase
MKYIEIKAPAKINIGLKVLSKREDGFHNLSTLFYPINDLYDTLIFEKSNYFSFLCDAQNIPKDNSNLIVKAKNILEIETNKKILVKIKLIKRIPTEAGLGGGSSDAATTLISLNEMFSLGLNYEKLITLSLKLGSDVPFFIKPKPSIGKSRGEILEPIDLEIQEPILIVNPKIKVSTKEAFSEIQPFNSEIDYQSLISNGKIDYQLLKEKVTNDFEKNIFSHYPEIKNIKNIMLENGALFSLMTGTGSTVFGIFNNVEEAEKVVQLFPKNYFTFISNYLS